MTSPALEFDLLVLGAGPGGYSAAFRGADLGLNTVLVDKEDTLGGVCLNVGCIPSKALLHVTHATETALSLASHGIVFTPPGIDLDRLRQWKQSVVNKLTGGLAQMAKARKVSVMRGTGRFVDAHHLEVTPPGAEPTLVRFSKAIIAAGSQPVSLPFLPVDPRIVDSTGALALPFVPQRMLVIGGGIIGLEMATVYSVLGSRIHVVEMQDGLMTGADRDLVKLWSRSNTRRFEKIMLKTRTTAVEAREDALWVTFEGEQAPADALPYDLVLVAVGRRPNGHLLGAEQAGVQVDERGFIPVDAQQRTNVPHIHAIGDITPGPMLAHKAVHEGHVAAEAAEGQRRYMDARQIPSVAYTDPEVAWTGVTEDQARAQGLEYEKAVFPWAASGRAIASGYEDGATKLLFDKATQRVIGGGIVGLHAGDLIGEICLGIEMGAEAMDLARTIHPHPTLGETVGMAAELHEGVCTDLLPPRKR